MADNRDADMIIEHPKEEMIGESLEITSTSPARVKMMSIRKLRRISYCVSEFSPKPIYRLR